MMTPDWHDFLLAQGAVPGPVPGSITAFGDLAGERTAASASAVLCDLSHLGVIGFSGDDALVNRTRNSRSAYLWASSSPHRAM